MAFSTGLSNTFGVPAIPRSSLREVPNTPRSLGEASRVSGHTAQA